MLPGGAGKLEQGPRRVTRHMQGTYGRVGRTEGVYLSQEETLQRNSRGGWRYSSANMCNPRIRLVWPLETRLKPMCSFEERFFFFFFTF